MADPKSKYLTQRRRDAEAQRRRGNSCAIAIKASPGAMENSKLKTENSKLCDACAMANPKFAIRNPKLLVPGAMENSKLKTENSKLRDASATADPKSKYLTQRCGGAETQGEFLCHRESHPSFAMEN